MNDGATTTPLDLACTEIIVTGVPCDQLQNTYGSHMSHVSRCKFAYTQFISPVYKTRHMQDTKLQRDRIH